MQWPVVVVMRLWRGHDPARQTGDEREWWAVDLLIDARGARRSHARASCYYGRREIRGAGPICGSLPSGSWKSFLLTWKHKPLKLWYGCLLQQSADTHHDTCPSEPSSGAPEHCR